MKITDVLFEFAPGGNSASSYYAVTSNFVNEFAQQKQEELQDLIDAGWTKQDLAQAGTLQGQAADMAHFEQVRDGFLKGLKPGFDAYLRGDTQLKDQLGAYWMDNDLPLNQDWEKIYGEPWGDDGAFDEGVAEGADERRQNALWAQITAHEKAAKKSKDLKQQHHLKMADQLRSQLKTSDNVAEGDVVQFPKKHRGDITDMHECPKCGGDLQGGKYMGHAVQVCMPCKQVYLPPNSGIDQQGNKIENEGKDNKPEQPEADYGDDYQAMVSRVKKLAGLGPLKTVYDPTKRVYKNVPTAVQPKK